MGTARNCPSMVTVVELVLYLCVTISSISAAITLKKQTPFDHLLHGNYGLTYIVSTNPCMEKNEVAITVFNGQTLSLTKRLTSVENGIYEIDGEVKLEILKHKIFNQNLPLQNQASRLLINLTESKNNKSEVIQTVFPLFNKHCISKNKNYAKLWNVKNDVICDAGFRMSEFSTICVVNSSKYTEHGIYLLFADFCSVPYSFLIGSITKSYTHFSRLTWSEANNIFRVFHDNNECGLHIYVSRKLTNAYDVEMGYACSSNSHGQPLIHDQYESEHSMMCPSHHCKNFNNGSKLSSCILPWVYKEDKYVSVKIDILSFDICKKNEELHFTISIDDQHQKHFHLVANHDETWKTKEFVQAFNVSFLEKYVQHDMVGFLRLNGGKISLFVKKFPDHYKLVILRHYPTDSDVFPLLQTEYWKTKKQCPAQSSQSSLGLTIGLPIAIMFILVLGVAIGLWWRKKILLRGNNDGLPYRIHLGDDEEELDDF